MDTTKHKFYVTTPIYYGTAKPHLGSLYSTLLADVVARWYKLKNYNVFFLTGTDEHGQKIEHAAAKAGMEPQAFVDKHVLAYKRVWQEYHIDYTYFIRTTDRLHKKAIQKWLCDLIDKGYIYKSQYEGWYCISCETYVTHDLNEKNAPICPSCGRQTEQLSEESYFFKLSAFQDKLLNFYKKHPQFIVPKERLQEVINFVQDGLHDLSISRTTVKWGIPFPNDEKHITYVWADALNNYITAIGYGQENKQNEFSYWWPADLQVLGKDIVRFHAIYWPAFLMASDLPLPKQLLVHGWINVDQKKMSKSFGNVIDPQALHDDYGADPVRYYLLRECSIAQDTDFSIKHLEQRIASDLANDLGNLLNRMTSLAEKNNCMSISCPKVWSEKSLALRDVCWDMLDDVQELIEAYQFHLALAEIWKCIHQINAYFHGCEPWRLTKTDPVLFQEVLSATCHALRTVTVVLLPIMPEKMRILLESLGQRVIIGKHDLIAQLQEDSWQTNFSIKKIPTLFEKPESEESMEEAKELETNYVDIKQFADIELRVGTITSCEEVPKSEKLYRLQIDFGNLGVRQILSGIRKYFAPGDLIGKQVLCVTNLKPRKMMGLDSQGMVLLADDGKGNLQLMQPESQVPNGTRLK